MTAPAHDSDGGRIGSLDGLRAAAILLVLADHYVVGGDVSRGLRSAVYKISAAGWIGVDLFFALSGFLITGILIRARNQPHRFRNFYARRTLRIFPLYYLALTIAFVIVPLATKCGWVPWSDQWPYWFYVANFRLRDVTSSCVSVGHFWSLAIEEQFYAFWPAVVLLTTSRTARRVCAGIVVASVAVRVAMVAAHVDWRHYYWTFARGDALACGSFVALCFTTEDDRKRLTQWSGPIAIVTGVMVAMLIWWNRIETIFTADESVRMLAGRILVPLLLALFFTSLLVLALQWRPLSRVLDIAPFRFIARYSYGLYVWHMMLIPLVIAFTPTLSLWPRATVGFAASFAAAIASYHLFESPFLALKRYFPQRHP